MGDIISARVAGMWVEKLGKTWVKLRKERRLDIGKLGNELLVPIKDLPPYFVEPDLRFTVSYLSRGKLYFAQNQYDKAIADLKEYIKISPFKQAKADSLKVLIEQIETEMKESEKQGT